MLGNDIGQTERHEAYNPRTNRRLSVSVMLSAMLHNIQLCEFVNITGL